MEDPDQWAFTWRAYKKKFKDRSETLNDFGRTRAAAREARAAAPSLAVSSAARPGRCPDRPGDDERRHVPQQPRSAGIRTGQALGLTVFLAHGGVPRSRSSHRTGRASTACSGRRLVSRRCAATVAAFAMLLDAFDLVRGRLAGAVSVQAFRSWSSSPCSSRCCPEPVGGNSLVSSPGAGADRLPVHRAAGPGVLAAATARGGRSGGRASRGSRAAGPPAGRGSARAARSAAEASGLAVTPA